MVIKKGKIIGVILSFSFLFFGCAKDEKVFYMNGIELGNEHVFKEEKKFNLEEVEKSVELQKVNEVFHGVSSSYSPNIKIYNEYNQKLDVKENLEVVLFIGNGKVSFGNLDIGTLDIENLDIEIKYINLNFAYIKISEKNGKIVDGAIINLNQKKLCKFLDEDIVKANENKFFFKFIEFDYDTIGNIDEDGNVYSFYLIDDKVALNKKENINIKNKILLDDYEIMATRYGEILFLNNKNRESNYLGFIYDFSKKSESFIENELKGLIILKDNDYDFFILEKENKGKIEYYLATIENQRIALNHKFDLDGNEERLIKIGLNSSNGDIYCLTDRENLIILTRKE